MGALGQVVRWWSAALGVVLLVTGLAVRGWGSGQWADKLGDLLYAAFVHCLVVAIAPGWAFVRSAAVTVCWCFAVEFLQLTSVPGRLADRVPGSALVLGRGFDPLDLVMYVLGALLPIGIWMLRRSDAATSGQSSRDPGRGPSGSGPTVGR